MRRSLSLLVTLAVLTSFLYPQSLQEKLAVAVQDLRGMAGLYVRHLKTGETVAINADTLFPTASMIKVPILCATFDKIDRGELSYRGNMTYRDSLLYAGEDILGSFRDSSEITISKVAMLMIATSDNTASLWLQLLSGTGTTINEWLDANGFRHTRVNSRTPGRQEIWKQYGWGMTTPREMAELLVMIREGRAVSPAASDEMYRVLSNIYWNSTALSEIPPTVNAASKQGAVDRSRSEVVLVNAPHGDYVFCVITKNLEDTSWGRDNEGFTLLRKVSAILWNHFEPDFGWKPVPGHENWVK